MTSERRVVNFSGRVQGVGFRFTACRVADTYDVTGTVRNLPSGQVECVVEGDPREIDAFLADLSGQMSRYVDNQTQQKSPCTGGFTTFGVTY